MDGYMFLDGPQESLPQGGTIRHSAVLEDGRVFVAWDDSPPTLGGVVLINEPIPDYPPSWPQSLRYKTPRLFTVIVEVPGWSPDSGYSLQPLDDISKLEDICGLSWALSDNSSTLLIGFDSDDSVAAPLRSAQLAASWFQPWWGPIKVNKVEAFWDARVLVQA